MAIPKDIVWERQTTVLPKDAWPAPVKSALDLITRGVKAYNAPLSPTAKRDAAQAIANRIKNNFEKEWKKAYWNMPLPAEIAALRVAADIEASAAIASSHKYDSVSCVAYAVKTGNFNKGILSAVLNRTQNKWERSDDLVEYTGAAYPVAPSPDKELKKMLAGDRADYALRCGWLKDAIDKAYELSISEHGDVPTTLKVFMAPEFYFRGAIGAYDISAVSEIFTLMRQHTKNAKFKDWLFIHGTVVAASFDLQLFCRYCKRAGAVQFKRVIEKGETQYICPNCNTQVHEKLLGARIDNVALIQKGGEDDEKNSRIVSKEYISHVDFQRHTEDWMFERGKNKTGEDNTVKFPDWDTARKIHIRNQTTYALPPTGSRDTEVETLRQAYTFPSPARASKLRKYSEESREGAIFTIDGIKFGLEICLDHLQGRLSAGSGIQIQLVPSAGAYLQQFACVRNGIAFNVDGIGGTSDVRINDSGAAPLDSSDPLRYKHHILTAPGGRVFVYDPQPIPW